MYIFSIKHLNAYEVVFARIKGFKYPEKDDEDAFFEEYFSKPRCVEVGMIVSMSGLRNSTPASIARIVPELDVKDFYYHVSNVFVHDRTSFDDNIVVKACKSTCDMKVSGCVLRKVRFRDDDDFLEPAKKFQMWQFSTLRTLINEHTQLFSKLSQC